jgi:hypothetical protein
MLLLLLAATAIQSSDLQLDGPSREWLDAHAPYGVDVTLDGKIWVNTNPPGMRDDYAILGKDLQKALDGRSSQPTAWIRGYHIGNPKVSFRETMELVTIDCMKNTIWVQKVLHYSANGELTDQSGPFGSEPVVPGSIGESWRKAVCEPSGY